MLVVTHNVDGVMEEAVGGVPFSNLDGDGDGRGDGARRRGSGSSVRHDRGKRW